MSLSARGRVLSLCVAAIAAPLVGCGDNQAASSPDAMVADGPAVIPPADAAPDANPQTPSRLIDTGLCIDAACTQLAADVKTYVPRWTLWTDGATKQRWIRLPPGTKIDNTDPNHWQFPVGTKLWKAFSLNGVRVETRYMVRLGSGENDWFMASYAWNAAQTDAVVLPSGRDNANGTSHHIPSMEECVDCHARIHGHVLGFSALALDYPGPVGALDLDDIAALGWLGTALPGTASPRYPLPAGRNAQETANAAEAVGYLHINCGHCHNPQSPVYAGTQVQFRLTTGQLASWPATVVYTSTVGVASQQVIDGASVVVKAQDPDGSVVIKRMTNPNEGIHMPALGSVVVDPTAQTRLRAWINSLPAN
jgi:hypothetical protein